MRRSGFLFLLLLVLTIIAVQTGRRLIFTLVYLVGATLIFSFLWAWLNLRWVALTRITQSKRVQVGRPAEERFIIRNTGFLPKLWLEMRDFSEMPGYRASRVINSLPPHRARGWAARSTARKRGRYRLGPMRLISGDPFGLFKLARNLPQTSSIVVYPATFPIPGFAPPVGQLLGGESLRRRTHHVTPNVAGVREYAPGDSFNRIHWPGVARTGRLIVKEFEEDPTANIWIVLDMCESVHTAVPGTPVVNLEHEPALLWLNEPQTAIEPATEEYAVTIAASLGQHFLEQNRAVGLIAHGVKREIVQPDRGLRQLTRLLESLAVLQARGTLSLEHVLTLEENFFTRGTTVIVVTPSPWPVWVDALRGLRRRGIRPIAVLVDAHSFDRRAPTSATLESALAIAGIPTYMVRQGEALGEALTAPAGGGRVVA
ncbi:MAG: DUF58 domain-containing protein [Ardenticatenaceae bacterium]|nr:DUF58 domain-containing protein [Ardenticatenaceae bacterium]